MIYRPCWFGISRIIIDKCKKAGLTTCVFKKVDDSSDIEQIGLSNDGNFVVLNVKQIDNENYVISMYVNGSLLPSFEMSLMNLVQEKDKTEYLNKISYFVSESVIPVFK
jgi:hypothetical protein